MGEAKYIYFTCLNLIFVKPRKMASFLNFAVRRHFSTSVARMGAGAGAGSGHGSMRMWKNISLFVALPAIGLTMVNAYLGEMEHMSHPRPPFVAYEHLRIRTKAFPWGDATKPFSTTPESTPYPMATRM